MALRPNKQEPNLAGVRRQTKAPEATMLATDIKAGEEFTSIPAYCANCNAYKVERVTVPNSVIMDELVAPTAEMLTGEALAKVVSRDDRITAKTAANPNPHSPSSKWGSMQIMQRAIDMRNQGLIPFSPFHPFIEQDGLRGRPIFEEWLRRYEADRPESSRFDGTPVAAIGMEGKAEPHEERELNGAEAALDVVAAGMGSTLPAAEDTEGLEVTADPESTLIDEVPTGRDDLLKWVGQDRERAIAASWVEGQRRNGRRKTVDNHLIPLICE